MSLEHTHEGEAAARALALMVSANGRIDPAELSMLDRLDAYRRMGVSRERFAALAQECLEDHTRSLQGPWRRLTEQRYVDEVLLGVSNPQQRLLVCRLAAAAITADGRVTSDERRLYDHALASWRISQNMVTRAIMKDRVH
jgi:hypothetical protein